ncbi:hypothetical protein [Streptomyces clavuligerus]|nr:hypothetical protein [Streptomyces clavuligerus]WDN57355.1 hypothetical protein LL058_36900 [Streptomyces clavuligerus]
MRRTGRTRALALSALLAAVLGAGSTVTAHAAEGRAATVTARTADTADTAGGDAGALSRTFPGYFTTEGDALLMGFTLVATSKAVDYLVSYVIDRGWQLIYW